MTTRHLLEAAEETNLHEIRKTRRADRMRKARDAHEGTAHLTVGQRVADTVAAAMGSWKFIILQSGLLFLWIVLNVTAYVQKWDPYPFILLNLALSFQAAYAAPFIMMSQNRQQDIDREAAACDYQVNIKAELEIELLHQKLDQLRESEVYALTQAVADLTHLLHETRAELRESRAERDEIARDASGAGGLFKP
ncbi:DUF1003 domain-containing protein [Novosphingobium sp.]|uniref:DUF1003 domain-containing protein n=1 Tax=Novosphingobium sp. TaxID=1874826 RepID=UPI003D13613B